MRLEFDGFEELAETLESLPDAIDADLDDSVGDGMDLFLAEAGRLAPSDPEHPGDLSNSMVRETTDRQRDVVEMAGGPDLSHWYGIFPEFGTRHQVAQPYMRPAFDTKSAEVFQRIVDGVEGSIERVTR